MPFTFAISIELAKNHHLLGGWDNSQVIADAIINDDVWELGLTH